MEQTKHDLLRQAGGSVADEVHRAATDGRVTVADLVSFAIGQRVWARYEKGQLARAVAHLSPETLKVLHALKESWPPPKPPSWSITSIGKLVPDGESLEQTLRRHLKEEDLPVVIQVSPGITVCARHIGSDGEPRGVDNPDLVLELRSCFQLDPVDSEP